AARKILHNEPWGSPAYRKALDDLNHLRDAEGVDRSREQAARAAAATRRVEHSISIGVLLCILACPPVVWVFLTIPRRLRLPPLGKGELRRPRRLNLLAAAAAISAMLFVATSALWIRSLMVSDELIYVIRSPARLAVNDVQLRTVKDTVQFWWFERIFTARKGYELLDPGSATNVFRAKDDLLFETPGLKYRTRPAMGLWGFHFERTLWLPSPTGTVTTKGSMLFVSLPLWVFMLIWMILPTFWVRRRLRIIRNAGRTLCATCGYDLRETPARCPECGTSPVTVE
ncbi:MAG TPA: hypothetical protein VH370_03930, partial [Humisphaera sp.]|nr:hypothetical protein [Humisphaera sp.]